MYLDVLRQTGLQRRDNLSDRVAGSHEAGPYRSSPRPGKSHFEELLTRPSITLILGSCTFMVVTERSLLLGMP